MASRAQEFDRKLGACVDVERVIRGMTQQQLAEKAGVTYQQIHKYLKGINRMSVGRFMDVCVALDVTPSCVLRQIVAKQPSKNAGRDVLEMSRLYQSLSPRNRQIVSTMARSLSDEANDRSAEG